MKVTSIVGMGIAYMLGARAGRERYEQIRQWMSAAGDSPAMRDAKRKVKDAGSAVAGQARDKAADSVSNAVSGALGHFIANSDTRSTGTRSNSNSGRKTNRSRSRKTAAAG